MYQSQIGVRYAKSLFILAREKNKLEEVRNDIMLIYDTLNQSTDLNTLLEHPVIKPSQKIGALKKIFSSHINQITLSFLELVIRNKREVYLKRIAQNFIDIYKKNEGINSAILTTAYELSADEKKHLIGAIEKKTKSTIELKSVVDESIIGGLILQINDKELDMSILKQLQRFRNNLTEFDLNSIKKRKN